MSLIFLGSAIVGGLLLAGATRLHRSVAAYVALLGLGVLGIGIVASFISGDEGGPILLAGGVGLVWLHRWAQGDRRRLGLLRFAQEHGLRFRPRAKGAATEGFRLFGRGDGSRVRNLLQGEWDGTSIKAMDFDYFVTRTQWAGFRIKTWRRYSAAVLDLGANVPSVIAERNGAAGLSSDYMGFHDVQLNSDEFNRRFHVTTDDREFAYKFFDLGMLRWLMNQYDLLETEALGRKGLVVLPRLEPEEMGRLLDAAVGFSAHIPSLVRRQYSPADQVTP